MQRRYFGSIQTVQKLTRPQQIRDLHENSWCGLIEWTLNIKRNSEINFLEENWAIQSTITVRFGPETMKWELILVPEDVLIYIIIYSRIRAQVLANTDRFCSNLVQTLFSAITYRNTLAKIINLIFTLHKECWEFLGFMCIPHKLWFRGRKEYF